MAPPPTDGLLVVNAGSSSVKFALYAKDDLTLVAEGTAEGLTTEAPTFRMTGVGVPDSIDEPLEEPTHRAAFERVVHSLDRVPGLPNIVAAGHRVVHGGGKYDRHMPVTETVLTDLRSFVPLAPRHQPHNVAGIEALAEVTPDLPQVACFDTAFHAHMPPERTRLPIPQAAHDDGIRRYGFHGLSYQSIVERFETVTGDSLPKRTVIAHLGAGASLCAVLDGVGQYTTMAYSPLDGMMMASRPGRLDPGVLLHMIRLGGFDADRLERWLYDECGLAGISGEGGDMKILLESGSAEAKLAIDVYIDRLVQEIAGAVSAIDGVDALVFTGGVGENAATIRDSVLRRLSWLGFSLDEDRNAAGGPLITRPDGGPKAYRVPTDEQAVIAKACREVFD